MAKKTKAKSKNKNKSEVNQKLIQLWKQPIIDYLEVHERSMIADGLEPLITSKELLATPLQKLEGEPENKSHQMIVAVILNLLGWKALGKKRYKGKYRNVYGKCHNSQKTKNVELSETEGIKGNSVPHTKKALKNNSRSAKASYNKGCNDSVPLGSEPLVSDNNQSAIDILSKSTKVISVPISKEKTVLNGCDAIGIPLEIGDYLLWSEYEEGISVCEQLHKMEKECPELMVQCCAKLIHLESVNLDGKGYLLLFAQWFNQKYFTLFAEDNSEQTGNYSIKFKQVRKAHYIDGQWIL